jgi:hypothetical protein
MALVEKAMRRRAGCAPHTHADEALEDLSTGEARPGCRLNHGS